MVSNKEKDAIHYDNHWPTPLPACPCYSFSLLLLINAKYQRPRCFWKACTCEHTYRDAAGGAHCNVLAGISGWHHHSGGTATCNHDSVEHNVRQHNAEEQDTMFPHTEPRQLIWQCRQMAVSEQVIDWTRLIIIPSGCSANQPQTANKSTFLVVDDVVQDCQTTPVFPCGASRFDCVLWIKIRRLKCCMLKPRVIWCINTDWHIRKEPNIMIRLYKIPLYIFHPLALFSLCLWAEDCCLSSSAQPVLSPAKIPCAYNISHWHLAEGWYTHTHTLWIEEVS